MKDNRIALRKDMSIVLTPFGVDAKDSVTFHIEDEIARGGSAICYEAWYCDKNNNKISGSLKEFYPVDYGVPAFDLARDDAIEDLHKNQLYSYKGTLNQFLNFKSGYIHPYNELATIRNETTEYPVAKDLNRYFPVFELYSGIAPEGKEADNCSVYVWVKNEPDIITFKEVLNDVCDRMLDGNFNRVIDLALILHSILVLAKAVDTLHLFGLYHLDLKPENFGIKTFRGEADKDVGISLYDINSLYSARGRNSVVLSAGTKYFRSPEVARCYTELFGPRSDVYSLGAILYYSLIIEKRTDERTGMEVYKNIHFCEGKEEFSEDEYRDIGVRLRNSEFLGDTDETGNSIIFGQLYKILQKSLNINHYTNNNGFYDTAADFCKDLETVIAQLGAIEGNHAITGNTKYYVEPLYKKKEDYYAEQNKNGASGVLQWLLYQYPLYDYCVKRENEEDGCDVLVLGGATYASKFIDLAFELSQVKNCRLNITVVSKDKDGDKSNYLATRPAMSRFFEIDGEKAKDVPEDPYGRLRFVKQELKLENPNVLREELEELRKKCDYTYVFVSLGEETANKTAAEAYAKIAAGKSETANKTAAEANAKIATGESKKLVSYITFQGRTEEVEVKDADDSVKVLQLSVFDSIDRQSEYEQLRRMAFNVHLSWADGYINNIPKARGEFSSKYNYNSSLENALSIRYKLHSIESEAGSRFNFSDPVALASQVVEIINLPSSGGKRSIVEELTMYEHRRWNVEKIVNSWQPLEDLSVLHTDTKDKAGRRHPCIVPANIEFSLYQNQWANIDSWTNATDARKNSLDGLDKLSINMHQHFVEEAKRLQRDSGELETQLDKIEKIVSQNSLAKCVSSDLTKCAKNMASGKIASLSGEIDRFEYYTRLLQGMKFNDADNKLLSEAIKKVKFLLFPVIQAAKKKNWKQIDENFIRNIPFVLTYSTSLHLCVPFFCETSENRDTTKLFGNVAAALMLNPLNLTYIVDGDIALHDMDGFKKSLGYCAETIQNHRLQTNIRVLILRNERDKLTPEDREALSEISEKIHLIDEIVFSGWNQTNALRSFLSQKSTSFTAIEVNKTSIGGLLQGANALSFSADDDFEGDGLFPMYTFDSKNQKFRTTKGCAFFKYVRNNPHILVDDLFYSRGKKANFSEPELIEEHDKLWGLYTSAISAEHRNTNTATWKNLCRTIKEHLDSSSRIAKIDIFPKKENREFAKDYSVVFPAFCRPSIQMIVDSLYEARFARAENYFFQSKPMITQIDSKSCRLSADKIRKDLADMFEEILANPFRLAEKSLIEIVYKSTEINILAYTLRVEKMKLPNDPQDKLNNRKKLLEKLVENGYIRSYRVDSEDQNVFSFTFSTENYMRLFKNEGNILELHVYRKAIESGKFDDVKNGATVFWNTVGSSNELDVVMIQGFRTYIVECKATKDLRQEYYDKLYPLNNTFGVNNIPILLADLNNSISQANQIQISRGEELGIKTIVDADEPIESILRI